MAASLELGLDTFGDVMTDAQGQPVSQAQALRNVVEEAVLADELGIDFIGLGEHHRADFAISAPEVALAAIASRTRRIRLGSAVTVLSSDDPIRVFQRFSTLNAISNGRAEVILGRGSFTESFPLFGFELSQYEELFEEKLDLFVALLRQEAVTWTGRTRPPLNNQRVFPRIESGELKTWIGVGGCPESVVRAARYDLPLMLAIIGGDPKRFQALCRPLSPRLRAARQTRAGHRRALAGLRRRHRRSGARRKSIPITNACATASAANAAGRPWRASEFEQEIAHGSLYVGSPETVARKIAATVKALGVSRFDMKYSAGGLSHDKMMRCIELYGAQGHSAGAGDAGVSSKPGIGDGP